MLAKLMGRLAHFSCLCFIVLLAACGGSEEAAKCKTSADCSTAGQLCIEGVCSPCQQSASCEADAVYSAAQQTQCREGLCTACSDGLVGCACVSGACTTGECVSNTCTDCTRGDIGCVCRANGTCQDGAVCGGDGLCAACAPGSLSCACRPDQSCDGNLICSAGMCVQNSCTPGAVDCPCDGGQCTSATNYCDPNNICRACSSDVAGCPCDFGQSCQGNNFCGQNDLCEACPETQRPATCGCNASQQCGQGLVCDSNSFECRTAVTCQDLNCVANQLCSVTSTGAFAGDAFCVPETCVPGFTWDMNSGTCIPQPTASCLDANGAPTETGLGCAAQSQACVDGPNGPTCVDTCETLGCSVARRSCMLGNTSTDNATCGACEPGYQDNQGTCEPIPDASCTGNGPNVIGNACAALNRECVDFNPGANCGGCLSGLAVNPRTGLCEAAAACGESQCFDGEFCFYPQDGTVPVCRARCAAGQALNEFGACVACGNLSCNNGIYGTQINNQCVCEEDVYCAYNVEGNGDRCQLNTCAAGEARDPATNTCRTCNLSCGSRVGETGRLWPVLDRSGTCACETLDDFFRPSGDTNAAQPCDADNDGWISRPAELTYVGAKRVINGRVDSAALANFRCARRSIDRVRLVNEYGQRREVGLCGGQVVDWAPRQMPPECSGAPTEVPLFETDALDDNDAIRRDNTRLPAYGGVNGRKFKAVELNPMTKACVSTEGDFNRNNVSDLREQQAVVRSQLQDPTVTDAEFLFQATSYFTELHTGYFEAGQGNAPGVYVVEERVRCESDFPLTYSVGRGAYWTACYRRRNAAYDGSTVSSDRVTMDFGQFSCSGTAGSCPMPDPVLAGMANRDGDAVIDHDVCAIRREGIVVPNEPWLGMGHHSQFSCAEISNGVGSHTVTQQLLSPGTSQQIVEFDFNGCRAVKCDAQAGCEESRRPSGDVNQPAHPVVSCGYEARSQVPLGSVGFVSRLYIQSVSQYERGCIDESLGTRTSVANQPGTVELNRGWSSLCPGFYGNPFGFQTTGSRGDFGKLICSCGIEFGGANCEEVCPVRPGEQATQTIVHVGYADAPTAAERATFDCIPGTNYCTQVPPDPQTNFPGGRRGFWMCGSMTSSRMPAGVDPTQSAMVDFGSGQVQATLVGSIKTPVSRGSTPMTTASTTACANGGANNCFQRSPGQFQQISIY